MADFGAFHARVRRRRRPRVVSFDRMVRDIARRFGTNAAVSWLRAVTGHRRLIDERGLRVALATGKVENVAAVVRPLKLQQAIQAAIQPPLLGAAQTTGLSSAAILGQHGLSFTFNRVHPNVVLHARKQAAKLVVGVPAETRQVIAEVIALGAQRGLTIVQQARAIRQVVGLPPNWVNAPAAFADELRAGDVAAAVSRRISGSLMVQIRSRVENDTMTEEFISDAVQAYTDSLINARALTIASTETHEAANHGLTESWKQAMDQGVIPDTARRFWIVTPDDKLSEAHATIPGMNPDGRAMDEPFETTEGLFMYPPSRPRCRCSVGLVINPDLSAGLDESGLPAAGDAGAGAGDVGDEATDEG